MIARAIVNASPVILLSRIGHLALLRTVAGQTFVPEAVEDEVRAKGGADAAATALRAATWITRLAVPDLPDTIAERELGRGESAVLAAALASPGAAAILDDRQARRCASDLGIATLGTIGVVVLARRAGAIVAARPVLDDLRAAGMYASTAIIRAALTLAGE